MDKTIHIEICKSEYVDNAFNLRIGDIKGSTEHSNISFDEVISDIKDEIRELINSQQLGKSKVDNGESPYLPNVKDADTFSTFYEKDIIKRELRQWEQIWGLYIPIGAEQDLIVRIKELKQENKSKGCRIYLDFNNSKRCGDVWNGELFLCKDCIKEAIENAKEINKQKIDNDNFYVGKQENNNDICPNCKSMRERGIEGQCICGHESKEHRQKVNRCTMCNCHKFQKQDNRVIDNRPESSLEQQKSNSQRDSNRPNSIKSLMDKDYDK